MIRWLAAFLRARFPLGFWLPIAGILVLAAAPAGGEGGRFDPHIIVRGFAACVVMLLLLRIIDDALDRKRDAARFPDRPLADPASLQPAMMWVGILALALVPLVSRGVGIAMALLACALVSIHGLKGFVTWSPLRGLLPQLKYPGIVLSLGIDGSLFSATLSGAAVVVVAIGAACYECATDEELRSQSLRARAAGVTLLGAFAALLLAGARWAFARGAPTP